LPVIIESDISIEGDKFQGATSYETHDLGGVEYQSDVVERRCYEASVTYEPTFILPDKGIVEHEWGEKVGYCWNEKLELGALWSPGLLVYDCFC
jgi:hypothetical protein